MNFFLILFGTLIGLYFARINIGISIFLILIYFYILKTNKKKWLLYVVPFLSFGFTKIPFPDVKNNSTISAIVVEAKENYYICKCGFKKYYVSDYENDKEVGDILKGKVDLFEIDFKTYESRFDFKAYLNNKGISNEIKFSKENYVFKNPFRIKQRINKFLQFFDGDTKALIKAILFNEKDYSSKLIGYANTLNLINLFAVNGIYIYFVLKLLDKFFFIYFDKEKSSLLTTVLAFPYLFFTHFKLGAIRIFLIRILNHINVCFFDKKFSRPTLISFAALCFLFIDYNFAYEQGFYIGFFLSFIMVIVNRNLLKAKYINKKLVPLAFIFTFMLPIMISNNNAFNILQIPFQIVLTPLLELTSIFSFFSLYVTPLPRILDFFTKCILYVLETSYKSNLSLPAGRFSTVTLFFYYVCYVCGVYFYECRQNSNVRKAFAFSILSIVFNLIPLRNIYEQSVFFINVGQGDSILIKDKNVSILIDTGGQSSFDIANETLIPFFRKNYIYNIDLLITTHNDFDHSGGVASLIQNFPVSKYITSKNDFPYKIGNINLINLNNSFHVDDNDNSLVIYFELLSKKFLLMGDAPKEVEDEIVLENPNLRCDILKVGHHGSNTSTSKKFISTVLPKEAIISVGKNNIYKHPHKETLTVLSDFNIKVRRTDLEGTISYTNIRKIV